MTNLTEQEKTEMAVQAVARMEEVLKLTGVNLKDISKEHMDIITKMYLQGLIDGIHKANEIYKEKFKNLTFNFE